MKAIGIFCIDSWHLANGIHCPDVKTSGIKEYDVAINFLVDTAEFYELRDDENKKITRELIVEHINHNNNRIFFSHPREGYLVFRKED